MEKQKFVKGKIGDTIRAVPEGKVQKRLENRENVLQQFLKKGHTRKEAEPIFKAALLRKSPNPKGILPSGRAHSPCPMA